MTDDVHDVEASPNDDPRAVAKRLRAEADRLDPPVGRKVPVPAEPIRISQLSDQKWFAVPANRAAALRAASRGELVDDRPKPAARPAVTEDVMRAARAAGERSAGRYTGKPGGGPVGRGLDVDSTIPRVDRLPRTGEIK